MTEFKNGGKKERENQIMNKCRNEEMEEGLEEKRKKE